MPNLPLEMRIPAWVTIPIITRDLLILIGSTIIFITTGVLKAKPLFIGKATTVLQMLTLFAALAQFDFRAQAAIHAVTFVFTIVSGARYVRMGGRMIQT
jgi:phosphatidylglycerophosphate synthase